MADTMRIGGIKLSEELVQIEFRDSGSAGTRLTDLLHLITRAKINLPHLHQGQINGEMRTSLCLAVADFFRLENLLNEILKKGIVQILPSVGTLSIFPHGSNLSFVSVVFRLFAAQEIPIHGINSSVSALVIHTNFADLDRGLTTLLSYFVLPENHTPFRSDYTLQQI